MRIAKLKSAYNSFIIEPRGLQCEPTDRISWAGNLLMSDLTFGPSFKVKQWFTGFNELSFCWIQVCIGSLMHRSSLVIWKCHIIISKHSNFYNNCPSIVMVKMLLITIFTPQVSEIEADSTIY